MTGLIRYETARKALAEAVAVDEVLEIHDQADAMKAYAHQARNTELEQRAVEIRERAERRLGELWEAQKATVGVNKGTAGKGRPKIGGLPKNPPKDTPPTLGDAGIDKNLAHRARKKAAMPEDEFEESVDEAKAKVIAPKPPRRPRAVDRGAVKSDGKFLSVSECVDQIRAAVRKVHNDNLEELADALEGYLETLRDRIDEAYTKADKIAVDKDPFDDESEDQTGGGQFYRGGI